MYTLFLLLLSAGQMKEFKISPLLVSTVSISPLMCFFGLMKLIKVSIMLIVIF